MNNISLASIIVLSIICVLIIVFSFFADYKIKRARALFEVEVAEANRNIKERTLYLKRLNSIGRITQPYEQSQIIADIYETLNKATVEHEKDPNAIPNPVNAALIATAYKYTIIENE